MKIPAQLDTIKQFGPTVVAVFFLRVSNILHPIQFYRALNIRVALVGLEVWSDADKCPITQDPFTTLHEFLDWRKVKLLPQKPHDNAQLIRCDVLTEQSKI